MNSGGMITLLISVLAIIISFLVYLTTKRYQERQTKLADVMEHLGRRQIQNLEDQDDRRRKAVLAAEILHRGREWTLQITNSGAASASDVQLRFSCRDQGTSPLVLADFQRKFPAPLLQAGGTINLLLAVSHDSARTYMARLDWDNPDGSTGYNEVFLSL